MWVDSKYDNNILYIIHLGNIPSEAEDTFKKNHVVDSKLLKDAEWIGMNLRTIYNKCNVCFMEHTGFLLRTFLDPSNDELFCKTFHVKYVTFARQQVWIQD